MSVENFFGGRGSSIHCVISKTYERDVFWIRQFCSRFRILDRIPRIGLGIYSSLFIIMVSSSTIVR